MRGDGTAAAQDVLRGLSPAIMKFAMVLTGDVDDAQDLSQAALLKLWQHRSSLHAARDPLPYALSVVYRAHASRSRRSWRREIPAPRLPEVGYVQGNAEEGLRELSYRLDRLPVKQRAAVLLRFGFDMPDEQIGELLSCSAVTVRSNISRALSRLRAELLEQREAVPR